MQRKRSSLHLTFQLKQLTFTAGFENRGSARTDTHTILWSLTQHVCIPSNNFLNILTSRRPTNTASDDPIGPCTCKDKQVVMVKVCEAEPTSTRAAFLYVAKQLKLGAAERITAHTWTRCTFFFLIPQTTQTQGESRTQILQTPGRK